MSPNNDAALYHSIQENDSGALEQLYDRYEKLLFSFAYKMTHNSGLAEEVVQDVFMKLWQGKALYDENKGKFSSWILTVVRYAAIDRIRREKPEDSLEFEERDSLQSNEPTTEESFLWQEDRMQLLDKVNDLNDDQRKIIDLFYFKGLTQKKIAEECHIPLGTVKGRIRLALTHLKNSLSDERGGWK